MDDLDARVRLAAFGFLEEQARLAGDESSLRRAVLQRGFIFEGQRVPLLGPQGIFKPRILSQIPLSITTVPVIEGEERPYDDAFGEDGVELRKDLLDEEDGPMLIHGLQGFHLKRLLVPHRESWRPDRDLLEERYALFRRAAG